MQEERDLLGLAGVQTFVTISGSILHHCQGRYYWHKYPQKIVYQLLQPHPNAHPVVQPCRKRQDNWKSNHACCDGWQYPIRCRGLWYNHLCQKTQEWSLSHSWTVTNNLSGIHMEWSTYHRYGDQDTWSAGTSSHVQHGCHLCSWLTHDNQYIRQSRVHCHLWQGQSQHLRNRTYQSICFKEANPQRVAQPGQRHVENPACQDISRPDIWPCDYSVAIKCRPTSLNCIPWSSPQCRQAEDKYNEHLLPPHISEIGNKGNMAQSINH